MGELDKVIFALPTGGHFSFGTHRISGEDKEVLIEIRPLDFLSEKKLAFKLAELIKKSIKDEKGPDIDSAPITKIVEAVKSLLLGSLELEWMDYIPQMALIIADAYKTGLDINDIQKMSLPLMVELIARQIQTDKESSKIASDFFTSIVKKVPAVNTIINLITATTTLINSASYLNSGSLNSSVSDMESYHET